MHTAVHQLIAGRGKELVHRPPRGRPCKLKLHYFKEMKGGRSLGGGGASNVWMMSEKGIKAKEGIIRNLPFGTSGERSE